MWLSLLVGGALAGCATGAVPPRDAAALAAIRTTEPVPPVVSMANELGRAALRERRFEDAVRWYGQAVATHPAMAEVHNGLAVALAALGRLDEAEDAIAQALAHGLDSEDLRANRHWLAQRRAEVASATASASADVTTAGLAAPAAEAPVEAEPAGPSPPAEATPVEAAPPPAPLPEAAAATAVPADPAAAPRVRRLRLEVSNGTGVEGLARRTARALAAGSDGVAPSRVTNHPNFDVVQTELQVRADTDTRLQRALIREVARTLGLSVAVVRVTTLAPGIDARLVIGHDSRDTAGPVAQRGGERRG